jgi:two-component system, NtrC family, sensor kinase
MENQIGSAGAAVDREAENSALERALAEALQQQRDTAEILEARTRELQESVEYQTATSEVLRVISDSPTELQRVLDTLVVSASKLCSTTDGVIARLDGDRLLIAAHYGSSPVPAGYALPAVRGTPSGLCILERRPIHVADLQAEVDGFPVGSAIARELGFRTILSVPLLREGTPLGVIILRRDQVRPFTDKQIELVTTFANQAVIAIGNAQLFEQLQARTRELSEALEQQTATSEVLQVISGSATDLQPVFDAIARNSVQLCGATYGIVFRFDGEVISVAAHRNLDDAALAALHRIFPARPDLRTLMGETLLARKVLHIRDVREHPQYTFLAAHQHALQMRTFLGIPMLRDGKPIGGIGLYRREVGLFTDRQIGLVHAFADQAVIAIENARLLNELRESLQQQTATADVLKVISRSTFDLETVLQTLVESAARLSEADQGTMTKQKDGVFYRAATYGFSAEFTEYIRSVPVALDSGSATGRALLESRTVHITDVQSDPGYTFDEAKRLGGFRTVLGVPMLREGTAIGVVTLTRKEMRPFTEKQIELVSTFADQAAIAIENVRLFESVQARTRELSQSLQELRTTQDRLVQTEKLASLGQLTAGIAHEIKNPLNFVNNFSAVSVELIGELRELLGRAQLDGELSAEIAEVAELLRGNLDKIVQHGKRADSIVKNMLLHAREGSGQHRPVDINAIVEESLNLAYHGARAERKGFNVTLEKSLDPTAGDVDLFPQEITRVLLNLISNGFYATSKRSTEAAGGYEPTVMASTRNLGDRVEIRIRDNGTGIPPEVRSKIFNPFFTTKPAGEGTGLGLSLSHDIVVKQHAGSIELDTQPGEFTEFTIVLPRAAASLAKSGEGP